MHNIPWYLALTISVPQAILMIYIGFTLCNINVEFKKSLICSVVIAVMAYIIRRLPIPLAANTLILTIVLVIITGLMFRIDIRKTLIAVLLGVMVSGVIEGAVIQTMLFISSYTPDELSIDAILNLAVYIPVFAVTLSVFYLIKHFNFIVFNLGEREHSAQI